MFNYSFTITLPVLWNLNFFGTDSFPYHYKSLYNLFKLKTIDDTYQILQNQSLLIIKLKHTVKANNSINSFLEILHRSLWTILVMDRNQSKFKWINYAISAWCPLKGHTYFNKLAAFSDLLVDTRTKGLTSIPLKTYVQSLSRLWEYD